MMYRHFIKRLLDFFLSMIGLLVLSPLLLFLTVLGVLKMKGNPFFTQERPGKGEKIFKLIKFKSMNEAKDKEGKLLPDDLRLTSYGRFLRKTSLDELPELFNILKGDMALVGPRPLLVRYLTRYSETQRRRHEVRPGLTGLAQISGRNAISWEKKFQLDVKYVEELSFFLDLKILFATVEKVLKREGISGEGTETMGEFMGNEKK